MERTQASLAAEAESAMARTQATIAANKAIADAKLSASRPTEMLNLAKHLRTVGNVGAAEALEAEAVKLMLGKTN